MGRFLGFYVVVLLLALLCEWAFNRYAPTLLPGYIGAAPRDFLKDVGSYLMAAQIGILAIVSVAVGVVTLLSDRQDGSSVNTDIRLYYVESYSYELAASGIALLVVLTLQLFWPLQHILHVVGLGGRDYSFKLGLAALHGLWFTFNLTLFLQFITTTLRFVEPSSREILRERYSANEVIPRDAEKRLLRALYFTAPTQIFGKQALSEGPNISFGHGMGLGETSVSEVTTTFSRPTRLFDVRLRPLQWVLMRWQRRVRQEATPSRQRFGEPRWNAQLSIQPNFDEVLDQSCNLALRRDGVPLTGFERWIIRRCFRFKRVSSHEIDLPTPENFLEQLVDKVVDQIEASATTGFRAALTDVIQYHRFILAAQNTKDESGNVFNLAEIGGFFTRPDAEWVRQYRRAFFAAADKIGSDTSFIDRLGSVAARLVPDDALNFSPRVLRGLLDLGVHEVVAFEDWLTRQAVRNSTDGEAGASLALGGSDTRAYETALISFVGSWEGLLQTLISSFGIERRPNAHAPDQQWVALAHAFPVFQAHLHNAGYFFAAAVWNDDALGADRFRDLLLRWVHPFYANLQGTYLFANTVLFTPDMLNQEWPDVQADVERRMQFPQPNVPPGPVSGMLLWELHCDVIGVSGLVALHWYATGQQPSEIAAQAAVLTLQRKVRASDGSNLTEMTPKTTFRLLFDLAVRYALNPRFSEARYSGTIDGLVQSLTNLASPRMVSGRVYGGFGIDGFDTLRPVMLAAMAANLPAQGDGGVAAMVERMKIDPLFQSDKTVRNFVWSIQQMVQFLADAQSVEVFETAAHAFDDELDLGPAVSRLRDILGGIVTTFEALRKERLRTAPLDESRMALVRQRITENILTHGPTIGCFQGYPIRRSDRGAIPTAEKEFGTIDRGSFVTPEMSNLNFDDLPQLFVDVSRECLAELEWHGLYHRPKRIVSIDGSEGTEIFWRRVIDEAPTVGPAPIVIIPYPRFGEEITAATLRASGPGLAGFDVFHLPNMPSGGGSGYLGTTEGIHIYSSRMMVGKALLCSSQIIRAIEYGVVHEPNDIVDFTFVDCDDLERSRVRLKFAQNIEWASDIFVEFRISAEKSD